MECCAQRGPDPIPLCPDNPGRACFQCLERSSDGAAERMSNNIRTLNEIASGQMIDTAVNVDSTSICVIL